ncbi:MAG: TatD family hydrolase [Candidatus Lokiarchaeota archaeon]|nr:TatD family hydrolase [Candidatus Lokiarchaeota archaeon]
MLIDVHCHVNLYLALDQIIQEAHVENVLKIIGVGMSVISLERILEISNRYDEIYPALGIHPEEVKVNENIVSQLPSVIDLIRHNQNKICAIGEIGLDHHFIKDKSLYPLQTIIFEKMLVLAQELDLPVNIHCKGAEDQVFETLLSFNIPNVNIHWYSGPEKQLKQGIDRGYFFSITPSIGYSPVSKKVVSNVPLERLLLESDGPVEYSGKVGTPAMIRDVLSSISEIKQIELGQLERQIEKNTKIIFPKLFSKEMQK